MISAVGERDETVGGASGAGNGVAWETVGPIVGAVAAGIGFLGFVTLFGGAVLWDRANQAGLPGTEAVAVMPRSLLVTTGAYVLAKPLFVSLLAVAVLWLADRYMRAQDRKVRDAEVAAALGAEAVEDSTASEDASRSTGVRNAATSLCEAIRREEAAEANLGAAAAAVDPDGDDEELADVVRRREVAVRDARRRVREPEDRLGQEFATRGSAASASGKRGRSPKAVRLAATAVGRAGAAESDARATEASARAAVDAALARDADAAEIQQRLDVLRESERSRRAREAEVARAKEGVADAVDQSMASHWFRLRLIWLGVAMVGGELVLLWFMPGLKWRRYLPPGGSYFWLGVIMLGTVALAMMVYQATRKFLWFSIAAFFAVAIFQGATTHFAIKDDPKVEPAVALLPGQAPLKGIFAAQTADRIYLGVGVDTTRRTTLVALRRDRVARLAVGPLTNATEAPAQAETMAELVCAELAGDATTSDAPDCSIYAWP